MDFQKIDELIEDFNYAIEMDSDEAMQLFFEKYCGIELSENITDEDIRKAIQTLMEKIESGDYAYFFDKITNGNHNQSIFF